MEKDINENNENSDRDALLECVLDNYRSLEHCIDNVMILDGDYKKNMTSKDVLAVLLSSKDIKKKTAEVDGKEGYVSYSSDKDDFVITVADGSTDEQYFDVYYSTRTYSKTPDQGAVDVVNYIEEEVIKKEQEIEIDEDEFGN